MNLDKITHALAGAVAAALANPFGAQWAILAALVAAVAKEAFDAWANARAASQGLPGPHTVDLADAGSTVVGGALMAAALDLVARVSA